MEGNETELKFHWEDKQVTPFEAITKVCHQVDETLEERGWDEPARLMLLEYGELAGYSTISARPILHDIPDPEKQLTQLAASALATAAVGDDSVVEFLEATTEVPFLGWMVSAEVWLTFPPDPMDEAAALTQAEGESAGQEPREARVVLAVTPISGPVAVSRIRGEPQAHPVSPDVLPGVLKSITALGLAVSFYRMQKLAPENGGDGN